jgi:hypothetical protein
MVKRVARSSLCALLAVIAVAACGGGSSAPSDNGVASKSPNDIVTSAVNAIDAAQSAHIQGSVNSGGQPITLNLDLVSGKGGSGSMSESGLGFQVRVIGNEVYVNGSPAFWKHFGGTAAATLFTGKWLKAPATGQFASLATLTNLHKLMDTLLTTHGTLTKIGTSTVGGQKAVGVRDKARDATLYVATTGKPYPIVVSKGGSGAGSLTLSKFNEPVTLAAPANAIDLSSFK